jgi:hypothetical protein
LLKIKNLSYGVPGRWITLWTISEILLPPCSIRWKLQWQQASR